MQGIWYLVSFLIRTSWITIYSRALSQIQVRYLRLARNLILTNLRAYVSLRDLWNCASKCINTKLSSWYLIFVPSTPVYTQLHYNMIIMYARIIRWSFECTVLYTFASVHGLQIEPSHIIARTEYTLVWFDYVLT